jgi:hypothetical protein
MHEVVLASRTQHTDSGATLLSTVTSRINVASIRLMTRITPLLDFERHVTSGPAQDEIMPRSGERAKPAADSGRSY